MALIFLLKFRDDTNSPNTLQQRSIIFFFLKKPLTNLVESLNEQERGSGGRGGRKVVLKGLCRAKKQEPSARRIPEANKTRGNHWSGGIKPPTLTCGKQHILLSPPRPSTKQK